MPITRIPIDSLTVGMYVHRIDRSWFRTPFLRHRFLITSEAQILKLKRAGIAEVQIDPARGLDVSHEATHHEDVHQPEPIAFDPVSHPVEPLPKSLYDLAAELTRAQEARQRLSRSVQSVFEQCLATGAVEKKDVDEAIREITIVTRTLTNPAIFMTLSRGRACDLRLSDHALSSCTLALILGHALGYDPSALRDLAAGALLHDVGLLQLSDSIVATSGRLSASARQQYERHPRLGAVFLEQRAQFSWPVLRIVAEHHATPDDHGYPKETPGSSTAESSRIVMIADRYDDLLTGQNGQAPLPSHRALQRLYEDGVASRLDQRLVSVFVKQVGIFPVHSEVELNTHERGIVTTLNPEALHAPIVTLTHAPDGTPFQLPVIVDLLRQPSAQPKRHIAQVVSTMGLAGPST